jgi:hypothetical protein
MEWSAMSSQERESQQLLLGSPAATNRHYFCAHCGVVITSESSRFHDNGEWERTFTNPAGNLFTIGLFHNADGCMTVGEATTDHSWFPGYAWDYAICSGCTTHLGWCYSRAGESFFGLILAELICP